MLEKLLIKDQTQRLGYTDSSEIMGHPFFEGVDWKLVIKRQNTSSTLKAQHGDSDMNKSTAHSRPDTMLITEYDEFEDNSRLGSIQQTVDGFSYDGGSVLGGSLKITSPKKSSRSSNLV